MWEALAKEATTVVFVTDRIGAALRRREHCLKLAAIPYVRQTERRASGTYHKVCVRESDAIQAHLALQMGGHQHSLKLQAGAQAFFASLFDFGRTMWDETHYLWERLIGFVLHAPKLLTWSGFRS
jgi:hypothetical protein